MVRGKGKRMWLCPIVAVTKSHKFSDLKQHRCVLAILGTRMTSKMGLIGPKSRCVQAAFLPGGSKGESISLLFQLLEAPLVLGT